MAKAKNTGNKVGAPVGNQNAVKWTEETVLAKLQDIEKEAAKASVLYIGQALANAGVYGQWYSEMAEKFKDSPIVSETIKKIDQLFEARLVNKTLVGDLNATMAIFTLKNKHKWKDSKDIDHTTNGKDIVGSMSEEEINARIQKLLGT